MRALMYAARKFYVEILSLKLSPSGFSAAGKSPQAEPKPRIALLSPVEIPIGAAFVVDNGGYDPLAGRSMGCAKNPGGRFLVLGIIGG